jgi:transposase
LLPHLAGVVEEEVVRDGDSVVVHARGAAEGVACPSCTTVSASVHGRYWRQLIDSANAGSTVLLRLLVRRFRCRREDCNTVTFAEQFDGLTAPHVRFSPPARRALTAVAVALAGRAGARLAQRLGIGVGRDTMLKLLRAVPDPEPDTIEILGIDLSRPRDYPGGLLVVPWNGCGGRFPWRRKPWQSG